MTPIEDYPGIETSRVKRRQQLDALYDSIRPRYEVWVIAPDAPNHGATYERQYLAHDATGYAAAYDSINAAERWEH